MIRGGHRMAVAALTVWCGSIVSLPAEAQLRSVRLKAPIARSQSWQWKSQRVSATVEVHRDGRITLSRPSASSVLLSRAQTYLPELGERVSAIRGLVTTGLGTMQWAGFNVADPPARAIEATIAPEQGIVKYSVADV